MSHLQGQQREARAGEISRQGGEVTFDALGDRPQPVLGGADDLLGAAPVDDRGGQSIRGDRRDRHEPLEEEE